MTRPMHRTRSRRYIPHAGKQLNDTTVGKGRPDDDVGLGDVTGAHVDAAQHEGGEGEGAEAQRGRVGKLAVLDGAVQAGLEFTSEGGQARLLGVDVR